MALKIVKKVEIYGQNIEIDCICRIEAIRGSKDEIICDCSFKKDDLIVDNSSYLFTPELGAVNFIEQGYLHLKTLIAFKDAIDC